ncbi:hypothetical protein BH23GEM11_BH23GEM11_03910 [soil metagenome]
MNADEILAKTGGLSSLANELGISEAQASSGATALLPAILGGFQKQADASPSGLAGLGSLLGSLGGGGLMDDVLAPRPTDVDKGNSVLGSIFGSKDVSRTVAQRASDTSGLDPAVLRKMLPMLAMLVAGYMAKQESQASPPETPPPAGAATGGLGSLVGGLLTARGSAERVSSPGKGRMGGLLDLLDSNGDGNPLDEILRMAGKHLRK